jgi:nitrogen fixation protein NifB
LCTNGLLLEEKIDELIEYNLKYLSITINALDYKIGAQIYNTVKYNEITYHGLEASKLLIDKQLKGFEVASKLNIHIKINTVYIPNINESEIIKIAKLCKEFNVTIMNIIPLMPAGKFSNLKVDNIILNKLRNEASQYVSQKQKCGRCRADAKGYICDGR